MGGALFKDGGTVTMTNSTLSSNSAVSGAGGSAPDSGQVAGGSGAGIGGAIFSLNGTTTILASTIASNAAGQGGAVELLALDGTVSLTVDRSLVADTVGLSDCHATLILGGTVSAHAQDNLIERDVDIDGQTGTHSCGGVVSTADPKLAPLALVAPGQTPVHALQAGSPAIDAVVGSCPEATDQRGVSRPVGARCDIGAFERSGADLRIVNGAPAQATAGTTMTATLTVTNLGPQSATGVQVDDPAPPGLTFVSNAGACATAFPCSLGTLTSGQQAVITTTFAVSPSYGGANPLQTTATVSASSLDSDPSNNSASATTTVQFQSDLSVTKTDNVSVVGTGQTTTYTIVVSNAGPSMATNARVQDAFLAAVSGAFWGCTSTAGSSCPASGGGNIDAQVTLAPAGQATFTATAAIASGATGPLTNTATASVPAGFTDPNTGNNSATDTDTIVNCAPASRPHVGVATSHGGGALLVTLTAGAGSLTSVQFGDAGQQPGVPTDAMIAVTSPAGGPSGITGAQRYTPPAGTSIVTLRITRLAAGPLTVPLVVSDLCGPWRTFVGAGAGAAL
jgi:uncharacterized repeat protein (TIGR01451 family)